MSDDEHVVLGPTLRSGAPGSAVAGWWSGEVSTPVMVVPDGGIDVIWTPGRRPWIAGPDTRVAAGTVAPGSVVVGLRLAPGAASTIIADSATSLRDQRVELDALLRGSVDRRVNERLHDARPVVAMIVLARLVDQIAGADWRPDPVVLDELDRIRSRRPVDDGSGRRRIRRRFGEAMGYGPKFFERIVRVDRFARLVRSHPSISLAEAAYLAGFHDQAHLSRDTMSLAGETPGSLARRSRRSPPSP